jgi:hypothetical protein
MKLKRKSKVGMWMAESRKQRVAQMLRPDLLDEELQDWLKEWRSTAESRAEIVRRMLENHEPLSKALKDTYPDNVAPAPLGIPR